MWLSLLAACVEAPRTEDPTWHADLAPIVTGSCAGCHVDGEIGPFPLDTYAAAASMATSMAEAVEARTMPPWGALETEECQPRFGWRDDPRLSDDEIALFRAWADAGAPEGDPATAAPLPEPLDLGLEGASTRLTPELPYVAHGEDDELRCFSLDPGLSSDAWLTGLQVEPGNPAVVHHVLVFADPSAESATLVGEDGTYPCFGASGLGDGRLLGAWAPGAFPFESPEGTGIRVTAGSRIVMQVHYHPAGRTADPDATSLALRWADERPEREALLALLGNAPSAAFGLLPGPADPASGPAFVIPAGAAEHTETIAYELPSLLGELPVFAAGTHMHYVGTDMLVTVEHAEPRPGEPATECLVQTPAWDFDWQRGYAYDAPLELVPRLRGGDTLRLRCTYDNTLGNPGTRAALSDAGLDAPVDVYLGEETLDEMCLAVFGIVL